MCDESTTVTRLGDGLHHRLQELAPGERVERGDRLVEHEQLGPLGERERERDLGLLAARELADLAGRAGARAARAARARARRPSAG